jgi:hypothetical protein
VDAVADAANAEQIPRAVTDQTRIPPPRVPTSGVGPPAPAPETAEPVHGGEAPKAEQPQKKRGFWGRLFGRGDKDKDKKKGG